jgi:hypothetical protein
MAQLASYEYLSVHSQPKEDRHEQLPGNLSRKGFVPIRG